MKHLGVQLRALFLLLIVCLLMLVIPYQLFARPFGGQIISISGCIKEAGGLDDRISVALGPPANGEFVWTTDTTTYPNGPPSHEGQWLIGIGGVPYSCVSSIFPVVTTKTGEYMVMVGSSL